MWVRPTSTNGVLEATAFSRSYVLSRASEHALVTECVSLKQTIESTDDATATPSAHRPKTPSGSRLAPGSSGIVRMSKLSLIDLAGSEQATSQTERRNEGAFINKSLLTLEKVIASLTEDSKKRSVAPIFSLQGSNARCFLLPRTGSMYRIVIRN